jgi:hypothetical protein
MAKPKPETTTRVSTAPVATKSEHNTKPTTSIAVPPAASKSETKAPAQTKSKPSSSKQNVKSEVKDEKDIKKPVEKGAVAAPKPVEPVTDKESVSKETKTTASKPTAAAKTEWILMDFANRDEDWTGDMDSTGDEDWSCDEDWTAILDSDDYRMEILMLEWRMEILMLEWRMEILMLANKLAVATTPNSSDPSTWNLLGLPKPVNPSETTTNDAGKSVKASLNVNKQKTSNKVQQANGSSAPKLPASHPLYFEVSYIPAHGNQYYVDTEFFKRVRARFYVLSSIVPSQNILNALLDAKKHGKIKNY